MELNIPENFLKGEVRDGFYVERMMKRNWACQIKVLSEVDRICKKYDIRYFAYRGTLLGAVRHKGFIPWDDDIDIGMLRPDMERFSRVAQDELPKDWKLLSMHTSVEWTDILSRVVMGTHISFEHSHLEEFYGFPYVVGIDILPLDYAPPTEEEDKYVRNVLNIVKNMIAFYRFESGSNEEREEQMRSLEEMCRIKLDRGRDMVNQLLKLQENLSRMYTEHETDKVACIPMYPNLNKEWFADTVMLDFEYIKVPAPVGYEKILETEYGKNWRTPIIGGQEHDYPYYRKQRRIMLDEIGMTGVTEIPAFAF